MKNQIQYIKTSFRTEWLKIKGLKLQLTGMILGAFMPVIFTIVSFFVEDARKYEGFDISVFSYRIFENYSTFGSFFLLIFIIISTSRIAQIDHRNNGWTFMETQPLSRFSIYFGKFLTVTLLTTLSIVSYYLFVIISSEILQLAYPQEAFNFGFETGILLHSMLRLWVLSLSIISIQLMLSMIIPSFIWPFVVGFLGFVLNIVSQIRGKYYDFIPYNLLQTGLGYSNPNRLNTFFNYTEYLSLFWTVVFIIIGYLVYSKKGFKNAFLEPKKRIAFALIGIIGFTGIYFLLANPTQIKKLDGKTIVQGTVQTTMKVDKIAIFKRELNQKIAEVPVKEGKFKWETTEDIPFGEYVIDVKNRKKTFYLSDGDDIQFDIKINSKESKFLQKGTRKADVAFNMRRTYSEFDRVVRNKQMTDKPDRFYKLALKKWEDDEKVINDFRNKENISISSDFKDYILQNKAFEMLNVLFDYQKMTSFTEEDYQIPKDLEERLLAYTKEPKQALLSTKTYKKWKINQLLPKEGAENPDSIIMVSLEKMPKSEEKDRLLSSQMIKMMKLTDEKTKREAFHQKWVNDFKNEGYKRYVTNQLQIINTQQKGAPFPRFEVVDKTGKTVVLTEEFKGKYIVVDWWATWCGPCKETSPAFEFEAKKYNSDKIVFVSVSIDKDKKTWELDIKGNKSKVKKFWLKNKQSINVLDIQSIPRFMIINPKGKMHNADLARPGESNFREALQEIASESYSYVSFSI